MGYDVVLIHPPSIYDFRKRTIFYGPVALTVPESTRQFIIPPVGMLSIAEYLDRNGYKVLVDNVGERMLASEGFRRRGAHLRGLSARVYAIGLHWCVHSQGAIEIARLCKRLHPEAMVVLGGLTATVFHEEIVREYDFVDAVIRGEAEKPFLALMKALDQGEKLDAVPNLTYRDGAGAVRSAPLMKPSTDLDEFDFTRLDLLEPREAIFPARHALSLVHTHLARLLSQLRHLRGLGLQLPDPPGQGASRHSEAPREIAEDLRRLSGQGVQNVFLFQDPRMGGKEYCSRLLSTLQNETLGLKQLTMELFGPADEEYIKALSKIGVPVVSDHLPGIVRGQRAEGLTDGNTPTRICSGRSSSARSTASLSASFR